MPDIKNSIGDNNFTANAARELMNRIKKDESLEQFSNLLIEIQKQSELGFEDLDIFVVVTDITKKLLSIRGFRHSEIREDSTACYMYRIGW